MQVFFRNCTRILTRIKGENFEDTFLVRIASKGTSLSDNDSSRNTKQFCNNFQMAASPPWRTQESFSRGTAKFYLFALWPQF